MIRIVGTSHISLDSIKKIDREIAESTDAVCVELDPIRYQSLKTGRRKSPKGPFMKLLYYIQGYLGRSTGMMPGEDMMHAVRAAQKSSIPCYLIDEDITTTVMRMKRIPLMEKIRLFLPTRMGGKLDLRRIPDSETIESSLRYLKRKSPTIYKILIEDRNRYMAKWIDAVSDTHDNILAVVGAGHVKGIERILKRSGKKVKVL